MIQELKNNPGFFYDLEPIDNIVDMNNKLFCTFTTEDNLEEVLASIQDRYRILYNKIYVLYLKSENEYVCTYNVDLANVSRFLSNTILVHRKKETNTLYTINSLNRLIETLNGGVLDTTYTINWQEYTNCILLTKGPELRRINTKLYRIVEVP